MYLRNISDIAKFEYKLLIDNFERDYMNIKSTMISDIRLLTNNNFRANTWQCAKDEYGRGSGYKDRVLRIYYDELNYLNSIINIDTRFGNAWSKILSNNGLK